MLTKTRSKPRLFYGYVVLAAAAIIQLVAWGTVDAYGVFFKPWSTDFGWSRALISGAASVSGLINGLMSIIMGSLNDRFGPRIVMAGCGVIYGIGFLLLTQLNSIWQLYFFYGIVIGTGVSGTDIITLSTAARWFVKRRGLASGLVKAGTGMGILAMPLVVSTLVANLGWRQAVLVLGVGALVIIVGVSQLLRREPADMGQLPDGGAPTDRPVVVLPGLTLREALRRRQFWMMAVIYFLICFCTNIIFIHLVPHATDLGFSPTNAAALLSIVGATSIIGRLAMGNLGDRKSYALAMTVCFVILLSTLVWIQWANQWWMLLLFVSVYGFAHGGFFALISPTVASLFGTTAHGKILGVIFFVGSIGGAISAVMAGYLFDVTRSYRVTFIIAAIFATMGLALMTQLKAVRERRQG